MKVPVLYGITHDENGLPAIRVPRVTKVGIGQPAGVGAHVYIDAATQRWTIKANVPQPQGKPSWKFVECASREEAEKRYAEAVRTCVAPNYPSKLSYFTFTRPSADGTFEPDWDAIEAHGPQPTEIDIVFLDDEPFFAAFEWWKSSACNCRGNGRDAMRLVELAATPAEKALAEQARKEGKRYFPIANGCYNFGCKYARPTFEGDRERPPLCKPHGRLQFQLMHSLSLGGTAQFDTTSYRSVANLFSSLMIFATWTGKGDPAAGRVAGLPLKLVLHAHKTRQGGAYNVALEFRAESVNGLMKQLGVAAAEFQRERAQLNQATDMKALPAPDPGLPEVPETDEEFDAMAREGAILTAEFYEGDPEPAPAPKSVLQVASATNDKAAALSERVSAMRAKRGGVKRAVPRAEDDFGVDPDDAAPNPEEMAQSPADQPPSPPEPAGLHDTPPATKPNGSAFRQPLQHTTSKGGWE